MKKKKGISPFKTYNNKNQVYSHYKPTSNGNSPSPSTSSSGDEFESQTHVRPSKIKQPDEEYVRLANMRKLAKQNKKNPPEEIKETPKKQPEPMQEKQEMRQQHEQPKFSKKQQQIHQKLQLQQHRENTPPELIMNYSSSDDFSDNENLWESFIPRPSLIASPRKETSKHRGYHHYNSQTSSSADESLSSRSSTLR